MKKLFYSLIAVMLLTVSCSNDSDSDMYADVLLSDQEFMKRANASSKGTFDMTWNADKVPLDTATFSTELDSYYTVISHFPVNIFIGMTGGTFPDEHIEYSPSSYWLLDLSFTGYSASNAYLSNSTWAPRTYYKYNGQDYACQIWMNTKSVSGDQTALMYDLQKDVWSGVISIDSFTIMRIQDSKTETWRKWRKDTTPLTLTFQTTGRKKK